MILHRAVDTALADSANLFYFGPFNAGDLIRSVRVNRARALVSTLGTLRVGLALFQARPDTLDLVTFGTGYQLVGPPDLGATTLIQGVRLLVIDGENLDFPIRELVGTRRFLGVYVSPLLIDCYGLAVSVDAEPNARGGGWTRP
jgi:hypothetical protein